MAIEKIDSKTKKKPLSVPLFRKEVMIGNSQWLGQVKLTQSNSSFVVLLVCVILSVAFLCFVLIGEYSRKTRVVGITSPLGQAATLAAPVAGTVKLAPTEGQPVSVDQRLFHIEADRWSDKGSLSTLIKQQIIARSENADAESRLLLKQFNDRARDLQERIRGTDRELIQIQEELSLVQARTDGAKAIADKYLSLNGNGYISSLQAQQKSDEYLEHLSKGVSARRTLEQLISVKRRLELEEKGLQTSYDKDLAQVNTRKLQVAQELMELEGRFGANVLAPKSGQITAVSVSAGQSVQAGQPLAILIGDDCNVQNAMQTCGENHNSVEVHLYIPSRFIGFVRVGQPVQLRIDAFPYQKFGMVIGITQEVSLAPFPPSDVPRIISSTIFDANQRMSQISSNEGLFRVRVSLPDQFIRTYGQALKIKPGLTLQADILQERRRIWEWALEPILAFNQAHIANK